MEYLQIHNWDRWQTYRKDRGQPPWIKIHRRIRLHPEWVELSDAERGQLIAIWLLAADKDGKIPDSPAIIKKLCFMNTEPDVNKFIHLGFIDSNGCRLDNHTTSERQPNVTPKAEAEAEAEADKKKPEGYALPSQEEIAEASIPKVKSDIQKACKDLYERDIFPKANAFVNKCLKHNYNPRAVLHTLTRVSLAKPKQPWAYAVKIMKVEDGNFNERDFIKAT